ncbi:DUF3369 domain-containing protein [candidate division KSB3 bacterium]|uniref:DUF3369 domain-containing protein n=1 Tax=candidate division KSB3 bacterium TaxID=2044937 RepID=A0A9D5Q6W1_9BACT|nr:DUF3369 domain-containing protein [candidate division KSB3 bacterium]MBD3325783.1 DUF3369 domain-containing protein [candidate division KSB3 bacterium]
MKRDAPLLFADEASNAGKIEQAPWKIVIADDEEEVHAVTRMVLDGFTFEGRGVQLLGAYSGQETKALLQEHPDTAVLLLDVVMEDDRTGLDVVRYVREQLNNTFVRIILRTGQPGQAPERQVTVEYDINDYKEKTELTAQKLFTTVIASLRAYRDLKIIERHRKGLELITSASAKLFEFRPLHQFIPEALLQLTALFSLASSPQTNQPAPQVSGMVLQQHHTRGYQCMSGVGQFNNSAPQEILTLETRNLLDQVLDQKQSVFLKETYVGYFYTRNGAEYLFYVRSPHELSEIEKGFIKILSANIHVAFDNISLNQEIEDTQREVIFTLGEVVETRSQETGHHVKRVGEFSHVLAKNYGLGEEVAEILRIASPMHDVGKIGIPDAILNKPTRLTSEEFECIKTHTTIGYNILKGSKQKILTTAAIIALEHHERWDGQGYPQGLKAEQINILARITKVADVFDSLSCRRVYKEPWDLDRILALFRQEKGKHFDPDLVDLLRDNLDEFLQIRRDFPDTE